MAKKVVSRWRWWAVGGKVESGGGHQYLSSRRITRWHLRLRGTRCRIILPHDARISASRLPALIHPLLLLPVNNRTALAQTRASSINGNRLLLTPSRNVHNDIFITNCHHIIGSNAAARHQTGGKRQQQTITTPRNIGGVTARRSARQRGAYLNRTAKASGGDWHSCGMAMNNNVAASASGIVAWRNISGSASSWQQRQRRVAWRKYQHHRHQAAIISARMAASAQPSAWRRNISAS